MEDIKNIVVFGLGFVGLPLSLSFAIRGANVIGVDISEELVNEINNGITYHTEKFNDLTIQEILKQQLEQGKFSTISDPGKIPSENNNYIVTVGIPIINGKYDYSHIESCCNSIAVILKKGDVVIVRSTVIPGTTEEVILPILEQKSGLKAGIDFYLAYSSERIAEGNAFEEFAYMPTVVGAVNKESLDKSIEILSIVCKAEIIRASNIKVVETSKLVENIQRDVNIAMVQEFARFTEGFGIDIYEVIKIANTHKRVNLLMPGPGVGGYCIPNAYYYLEPKAKEMGINIDLLKLSRLKNEDIPNVIVEMVEKKLSELNKKIEDCKIAVLGIAMKDYSNDDRVSPPISIINLLLDKKVTIYAYDPVVPTPYHYKYDSIEEVLHNADALIILAKQVPIDILTPEFVIKYLQKDAIIFDTRNMYAKDKDKFENNGMNYFSL